MPACGRQGVKGLEFWSFLPTGRQGNFGYDLMIGTWDLVIPELHPFLQLHRLRDQMDDLIEVERFRDDQIDPAFAHLLPV